jgi:multiple sugar transport system permease protein
MRSWRSSSERSPTSVASHAVAPRARPPRGRLARSTTWSASEAALGYAFIAPTLLVLGVFHLWPIAQTIGMSLFDWDLLTQQHRFIGLRNYQVLVASEELGSALRNTGYYVLGVVPVQTVLALVLAIVANRRIRGRTFFSAAFYFPSISSSVVVALIFLWILQGGGLADWVLTLLGGTPPRPAWLSNPNGVFARLCPSGAVHGGSARPVRIWRTSLRRNFLYVAENTDMKKPQRDTASPSCASREAGSLT